MIIGNANNGGPKVYDVTNYLDDHPGGKEVMTDLAGKNADELFEDIMSNDQWKRFGPSALSRPPDGPWVVSFDSVIEDDEADALTAVIIHCFAIRNMCLLKFCFPWAQEMCSIILNPPSNILHYFYSILLGQEIHLLYLLLDFLFPIQCLP